MKMSTKHHTMNFLKQKLLFFSGNKFIYRQNSIEVRCIKTIHHKSKFFNKSSPPKYYKHISLL